MTEKSVMEVTIKERENEMPGKRVRALGMFLRASLGPKYRLHIHIGA